jgi:hypothetical protein
MRFCTIPFVLLQLCAPGAADCLAADGVFVGFRLNGLAGVMYYVKVSGYAHQPN